MGLIKKILFHPIVNAIFSGIVGAFFLLLDVGSDINFVKVHGDVLKDVFLWLLMATVTISILKGIFEFSDSQREKKYVYFLEQLFLLAAQAVSEKLKRFQNAASKLKKNGDIFKHITKPDEQINLIISNVQNLFLNCFGIKEAELSCTIMRFDGLTARWHSFVELPKGKERTKPTVLMSNNSAAKHCLDIGEPFFAPDKVAASRSGHYYLSDRDKRNSNGSIYCYPIHVQTSDYKDTYVISISTYGKKLCRGSNSAENEAVSSILSEICRRIELELTLLSIKEWRFGRA